MTGAPLCELRVSNRVLLLIPRKPYPQGHLSSALRYKLHTTHPKHTTSGTDLLLVESLRASVFLLMLLQGRIQYTVCGILLQYLEEGHSFLDCRF